MIVIKTPQEIEIMRQGGRILARILDELVKAVKPGITTKDLDKLATELIFSFGAKSAFLGHQGFPAALCTSVNEEIVHVAPSERKLKEGDIIGLDLGILYPGQGCITCPLAKGCPSGDFSFQKFYTDMAVTIGVGQITSQAVKLIEVTKKSLEIGLEKVKSGNYIGDIGFAIQNYVEKQGLAVIRDLVGHGIGKKLHEDPKVPNFGQPKTGQELKVGMTLAIEPMVALGKYKIKKTKDGFGYETEDKSLTAHFEKTIAVTENGYQILTEI